VFVAAVVGFVAPRSVLLEEMEMAMETEQIEGARYI
jgi:hypothetical protein